ncbi:MAG: phage recombination protein Bet [Pseudomonadota bacterium]|nr:phage recombination protein Bet [Pseudomonadota bacterium]
MSNALVAQKSAPISALNESELIQVLKNSLYPGAKDESIKLVIGYCHASNLDPMQKPVHIVPMNVKDARTGEYEWRDVIMPGIGLYRIQAARAGKGAEYAGISEPEYGEEITETLDGCEINYPRWCRVTVRRLLPNGSIAEFTAREFWKENYAMKGGKEKSIAPNAMWFKRPYAQIAKCAEAQALRKGFPEIGSQPTAEEMEGKDFDNSSIIDGATGEVVKSVGVKPPQRRSQSQHKQEPVTADSVRPVSENQVKILKAKLNNAGITEAEMCQAFEIESIEALPFSKVNDALKWIEDPE